MIPNRDEVYSKAVKDAQKEYLALLALSGANATRFGELRDKLENESLFRNDDYPKDQAKLLHIMNKYGVCAGKDQGAPHHGCVQQLSQGVLEI